MPGRELLQYRYIKKYSLIYMYTLTINTDSIREQIKDVYYDIDSNTIISNAQDTSMIDAIFDALLEDKSQSMVQLCDKNYKHIKGEINTLTYEMIEGIEIYNLNKNAFVTTNILTTDNKSSIVRVDHITNKSASTEYFITKKGLEAIKNIYVVSHKEKLTKTFDNQTLYLHTSEAYDLFRRYHKFIAGKHIFINDQDIDTQRIPVMIGNYVYIMFDANYSTLVGLYNRFVKSHIYYNDDEYITDRLGFVKSQKHNTILEGELMQVDERGIIKNKSNYILVGSKSDIIPI